MREKDWLIRPDTYQGDNSVTIFVHYNHDAFEVSEEKNFVEVFELMKLHEQTCNQDMWMVEYQDTIGDPAVMKSWIGHALDSVEALKSAHAMSGDRKKITAIWKRMQ